MRLRRSIIDELQLHTSGDVHSFLYRWHELGEERYKGDLGVSDARLDVIDAIKRSDMWSGDVEAFHLVYFRGYEPAEAAKKLGVDVETIEARLERGCEKIAEWLTEHGYGIQ